MYDILVIGGGASGLTAAISAARTAPKLKIAIAEGLPRVGKKILATGNGRCNLTNLNANENSYNNSEFVKYAMNDYSPKSVIDFFNSIGLLCVADDMGRVYPMSNTASSVLDCLRFECERLNIENLCDTHVDKIERKSDCFVVNSKIQSKKIIVAVGGKASPSQGSDGSGYKLLEHFGHSITSLSPGLVQLMVKEGIVKSLKGVRVKANVSYFVDNRLIDKSEGEVLFTDYGLSGIAIMDISRSLTENNGLCSIDIAPQLDKKEITDFFELSKSRNSSQLAVNAMTGILPKKIGEAVLKNVGLKPTQQLSSLNNDDFSAIADTMKNFSFTVTGTKGFSNAQITVGGAKLDEFSPKTLESEKEKGLYCCGEILDVDSVCGGFNLQWAWASGLLAGKSAAK